MRLTYRGNEYEYQAVPVTMVESTMVGLYRGQRFQFSTPRHVPVPQPALMLNYRGVPYKLTETGTMEAVAIARAPRSTVSTPLHSYMKTSKELASEIAKVHHLNVERRLQHRLEVAQAKGDQNLIIQLQKEMQHLA